MKALSYELDASGILILTINIKHESMNVLNQEVVNEFTEVLDHIDNDDGIKAVIITSGKTDCFIAGADIKMLRDTQTAAEASNIVSQAHVLLQRIENHETPFIAAIDGVCLGAGYELSLACDYRIASDNTATKIGLPEVMLGLLPGATGTTKLSRLIALPSALDIILTGKQLNAKRALRIGMIDSVVPQAIITDAAISCAKKLIQQQPLRKKKAFLQKVLAWPVISHLIIHKAKQQVIKKTKGLYPAPLAILDVINKGLHQSLNNALRYEAEQFGKLAVTPEAKQLMQLYFVTTELKKASFVADDIKPSTISKIGILGGGLMGSGIATVSVDKANVSVRMKDIQDAGILGAYQYLNQFYKTRIKRRILCAEQAKKKINQFSGTLDYSGFESAELIIEAVFEDINVKHQMLKDIEALGNDHIIFASNTSSIPISDIAAKAKHPENVIGMHYFSPVEKMPLLEIIKHEGTSDQTIATAVDFGRKQGKTVIVVNDGAGFYVNRILTPYMNAALQLGADGVPFDKIDNALTQFGFPVGPIKLLDEVGIDIGSKILPVLEAAFGDRMKSCGMQQTLLDKGRLGKKVKKGFYNYTGKNKGIDESIYSDLGITQSKHMDQEAIIQYCLYPMLKEALLCLEDGIISSERDGNIGAIFGIGFPPFLGGPFEYMGNLGIKETVKNHR